MATFRRGGEIHVIEITGTTPFTWISGTKKTPLGEKPVYTTAFVGEFLVVDSTPKGLVFHVYKSMDEVRRDFLLDEDEDEPEIMELYRVPRGAERRAPRARAYERALPAPSSPYSLDPSFSRVPPMPDGVAPRHGDTRPVSA